MKKFQTNLEYKKGNLYLNKINITKMYKVNKKDK